MKNTIIRKAARVVVWDEKENKIAILEVKDGTYHKIPGGGIEDGESVEEAVSREALEESGCEVNIIGDLGEQNFVDPDGSGIVHHSRCFLGEKKNDHQKQYFTEEEVEKKFRLMWVTFDEAEKLFQGVTTAHSFELAMNNRDFEFVRRARKYIKNNAL